MNEANMNDHALDIALFIQCTSHLFGVLIRTSKS